MHLNEKNRNESFPTGAFCVENLNDIDDEFKEMVYRRCHNLPWEILETARLRLREITVEDVPRLYELYSDESITGYIEPLFADYAEEVEYTRSYIQNGLELGFMIGKKYQRMGYAYEICDAILKYGKEYLGVNDYRVLVDKDNIASINLSKKLGFVFAGESVTESEMTSDGTMTEHIYMVGLYNN